MVAVVAGCTTLLLPNGWSSKDQCNLHWFDPVTVSALQIISSSVADMNAWHVDKDSARSRTPCSLFVAWPHWKESQDWTGRVHSVAAGVSGSEVTLSEICGLQF